MDGPEGIKKIAEKTPALADQLNFEEFQKRGIKQMTMKGVKLG